MEVKRLFIFVKPVLKMIYYKKKQPFLNQKGCLNEHHEKIIMSLESDYKVILNQIHILFFKSKRHQEVVFTEIPFITE